MIHTNAMIKTDQKEKKGDFGPTCLIRILGRS